MTKCNYVIMLCINFFHISAAYYEIVHREHSWINYLSSADYFILFYIISSMVLSLKILLKTSVFPLRRSHRKNIAVLFWKAHRMWCKLHVTWPQSIPGQDHRKGTSQWTTGADYFPKTRRSIKNTPETLLGFLCSRCATSFLPFLRFSTKSAR